MILRQETTCSSATLEFRRETRVEEIIVGVVADTHGLLRRELLEVFKSADLIIHAGDLGKEVFLRGLEQPWCSWINFVVRFGMDGRLVVRLFTLLAEVRLKIR